jgi:hypothetical protein
VERELRFLSAAAADASVVKAIETLPAFAQEHRGH